LVSKTSKGGDRVQALDPSLAPISSLPDIFRHLVGQANKIKGGLDAVVDKLDGRGLRVGTMCS